MYILGICSYSHEATVALIKNGEIKYIIEEERLNREKHTWKFPINSIKLCLEREGITIEEIGEITFFMKPLKELYGNFFHVLKYFPKSLNLLKAKYGGSAGLSPFTRIQLCLNINKDIQKHFGAKKKLKVTFIEHHLAHASSCFHVSPFSEANILTIDGRGESTTTLLAFGNNEKIHKLKEVSVPHSLGHLYSAVTQHLGFTPLFDEWKVMGMSAYGTPALVKKFQELVLLDNEFLFKLNLSYFNFHNYGTSNWVSEKFIKAFGPARIKSDSYEQSHFDLAFALQKTVENTGVFLAKRLYELNPNKNLCLAGGVALNVLMNKKILEETKYEKIFIQPLANDAGTALGSALYHWHENLGHKRSNQFISPYLGPEYSDEEILASLRKQNLKFRTSTNVEFDAANFIAEGKILGWYQGRMEAGPRALGNRSILADPRDPKMKDRLNLRVKRREFFRPFAPSVLEEYSDEFFYIPKGHKSPYMIMSGVVKENKREIIPAVTHADFTARPHTVSRSVNEKYWKLIDEFRKLTGVPVVINTSFNENEPIVCTPDEAINCFLRTDFDVLIIHNFILEK